MIGWFQGGKTPVACSTMSTRVVTTMMTSMPATTAQIDCLFMNCSAGRRNPCLHASSERLRRRVAPGRNESFAHHALGGGPQPHARGAAASPRALHRYKDFGVNLDKKFLLIRRELYHSPPRSGVPESCEDFPANAKIRMAHVG